MALVECVPNFSEGINTEVIDAISSAIRNTNGCHLLDVDPGTSTNRTVYTFVGSPDAVVQGALNTAKVAYELIDMSKHSGEHPRMGALDVCPFIPLRGVTMDDCVRCAESFGEKCAEMLNVPVYLYGAAARSGDRKRLPDVRSGEYEGLKDKLLKPECKPDFGPAKFVPIWGATATGARKFLIAYNVNMLSTKEQAHRIALNIREQGRGDQPGRLKAVQGIGWWLEECNLAQVSVNILDHDLTPIHTVYEECVKDAKEMNLAVTGSQIVGLVPLNALLQAAEYYIGKENLFILREDQKIRLAVDRLGLSSISPFIPHERIIEYLVKENKDGDLVNQTLTDFIDSVSARTASPGGGTVAALCSTLGASLTSMVGLLSFGNRKFEHLDSQMRELIPPLYHSIEKLREFIDADAEAYNRVILSSRLPKNTDEEKKKRETAIQESLQYAAQVPLDLAIQSNKLWSGLENMSKIGNINCKSDLLVAAKCLETGVFGARCNVLINLGSVNDEEFVRSARAKIEGAWSTAREHCASVIEVLEKRKQ